jgi:hypothetical protein
MLLELACIVAGFVAGMTYAQERDWQRYRRTRREVEEEVGRDFDYYKNLSESLKQDVKQLKSQLGRKDT